MENLWTIEYFDIFIRLSLAVLLGGLIGFEREMHNHPAGFRTHILVSIGSTLMMLISIYGFSDFVIYGNINFDPSRIAAQVVTGIGFLGAGTILRHGYNVTGLTTAASLWVVAGIGLAVGAGFYFGALLTTFFVLISLAALAKIDPYIAKKKHLIELKVCVIDSPGKLGEIATKLGNRKVNVKSININEEEKDNVGRSVASIKFLLHIQKNENIAIIVDEINQISGVKEVSYGKNTE